MAIAARRLEVSARDRRILQRAMKKLGGARADFGEALRALREATEETIPGGRVFLLGVTEAGPILGSNISGVGIAPGAEGVEIVRAGVRIGRLG